MGGQYRRRELEHFPQLWCGNESYSLYGQASQFVFHTSCKAGAPSPALVWQRVLLAVRPGKCGTHTMLPRKVPCCAPGSSQRADA